MTSPLPLILTGGITRRETAERALASGIAVVGMGTALALTQDLPNRWRAGLEATRRLRPVTWSDNDSGSKHSPARSWGGSPEDEPWTPKNHSSSGPFI